MYTLITAAILWDTRYDVVVATTITLVEGRGEYMTYETLQIFTNFPSTEGDWKQEK